MAIQIPGRCGSTGDFFVSGVRSVFLWKTDLTPCTNSSGELSKAGGGPGGGGGAGRGRRASPPRRVLGGAPPPAPPPPPPNARFFP
ncbi:hypothetical protein DI494_21205, partial [Stenotrophomonas maltophilia]